MMTGIMIWTVANVVFSLSVMFIMIYLYGKAVDQGWQKTSFSLSRIKMRRGIRRCMYGITICYGGKACFNQFLNPDFEKYEFSFQELDWHERDKKRCFKTFLFMLITFESILCMIAFEA